MNYEEMSDFEINKAVVRALNTGKVFAMFTDELLQCVYMDPMSDDKFDPCNNPTDMWPIIFDNKIETCWYCGDQWRAIIDNQFQSGDFKRIAYCHENPLRAAAIVFLKMQDTKVND